MASPAGLFSFKRNLRDFFIQPGSQLPELDGLRALSIIYVVIFHAFYLIRPEFKSPELFINFVDGMPAYAMWVWQGDKGVDMFFILSGFLIASILMQEHQRTGQLNIRSFYAKRAIRILPVYILAILIAIASRKGGGNSEYFWANLLFINNIIPLDKILIPWSWSLSIEVQFYVIFPFLLLLLYKSRRPFFWLLMIFLSATLIRYAVILANPALYEKHFYQLAVREGATPYFFFEKLYVNIYTRMGPLLLGVILAYLYYYKRERVADYLHAHTRLVGAAGITALVMLVVITSIPVFNLKVEFSQTFNLHNMALSRNLFASAISVIMLLALFRVGIGKLFHRFLAMPVWYPFARGAYSMYLFHIPFLGLAYLTLGVKTGKHLTGMELHTIFSAALLGLMFSMVFCLLVYMLVEKPCINIYKKQPRTQ
ncbi:MAG: acyltransferase [Gammaproteobacteria bacterium]|nr:acyltransferase [Gammaproteobacteria bacterium]